MKSKSKQPVYILGINDSHGASAALLRNGVIIACVMEERLTRKKGQMGYPLNAIKYCLQSADIKPEQVDRIVFGFTNLSFAIHGSYQSESSVYGLSYSFLSNILKTSLISFVSRISFLYFLYKFIYSTIYAWMNSFILERSRKKLVDAMFYTHGNQVIILDHHLAHATAAYYSSPFAKEKRGKVLVITNDGMGDRVCSRIYIVQNDHWQEIASTSNKHSLGVLYGCVTEYLGMKANEEYKVMGLAPYSHRAAAEEIAAIFRRIIFVEGLSLKSTIPEIGYPGYIQKHLAKKRFDAIAGGLQLLTEEILTTLVRNVVKNTNIHSISVGGGVFMNIKANMEISKMPEVENMFVMPSSGDESTAMGACYWGYKMYCEENNLRFRTEPLSSLYLGPSYSLSEIEEALNAFLKKNPRVKMTHLNHPAKHVAKLIREGGIIARFAGRMEYGARALGNRSILANPSDRNVIRMINDQIKCRDFWMPFAPVILEEYADEYLIRPNKITSQHMMVGYETKEKARTDLFSAIHPYDYTARPQLLRREINSDYYDIVDEFRRLSGIAALLNTSFNIHGDPIVCSPTEALDTFLRSGLEYLLLEDFLVWK